MGFFIIGGFFFIVLGFGIHVLKWHFLISGYNTMSKEKKKNVDVKKLGKLIGFYMYSNGALMILVGVLERWEIADFISIWVAYMLVSTAYLLIKAQRYDGNMVDEKGNWTKQGKKEMKLVFGILAASALFVIFVFALSSRPIQVDVTSEGFAISGMYGSTYLWSDVKEVVLLEKLPTIERRTNGSEWGSHLKGNFRTKEYGGAKLFVNKDKSPFVIVETTDHTVIFNLEEPEETRKTYEIFRKNLN